MNMSSPQISSLKQLNMCQKFENILPLSFMD